MEFSPLFTGVAFARRKLFIVIIELFIKIPIDFDGILGFLLNFVIFK